MKSGIRKRILPLFAVLMLVIPGCSGAAETGEQEIIFNIEDRLENARILAEPYYEHAVLVAQLSPDFGRNFTDHKIGHAEMVMEKALEVGYALMYAAERGTLGGEAAEGRVALSAEIDPVALETAALFHDTGMLGEGFALSEAVDGNGEPLLDENGSQMFAKDENGLYRMHLEEKMNFREIRTNHALNSGLFVLVNRLFLVDFGYTDAQVDRMAAACMAHSKSSSGVRDLNSKADWSEGFDRLDSIVAAWNREFPYAPISFNRSLFEEDDAQLGALAAETLALRIGDVSRDSGPDAEVQTGEVVHVERETLNNRGGSIPAELEGAVIRIGDEDVPEEKSRQVHAGEQNIPENHTYADADGRVIHEITIADGCSAPRCTQQAVDDHLGEMYSARDCRFTVQILFRQFEDDEDGFFRDSWEDFRTQAANDYCNIEIRYPWDEEVSE